MSLNVQVLEESFAEIKPYATKFASRFYYNLFENNPELEPLFANTNMVEQEQKLVQTLVLVVWNLRNLTYLSSLLQDLGERHVRYGTVQAHYPMIGDALLKTFEFYLGTNWTPEVQQAWTDAYAAIVNIMLEGAKSAEKVAELGNVPPLTTNPATVAFASTPLPATASSQDDSEKVAELGNVPPLTTNPATVASASTPPPATASRCDPKLTLILFVIASSFGVGLLHYYSYLMKGQQEITTPTEKMPTKLKNKLKTTLQ